MGVCFSCKGWGRSPYDPQQSVARTTTDDMRTRPKSSSSNAPPNNHRIDENGTVEHDHPRSSPTEATATKTKPKAKTTTKTKTAAHNASAASRGMQPSQSKQQARPPEKPGAGMPPNPEVPSHPSSSGSGMPSRPKAPDRVRVPDLPGIPAIDTSGMEVTTPMTQGWPDSPLNIRDVPLIRNLTPKEIARGEGLLIERPPMRDVDGDEAHEFIICESVNCDQL